MTRMARRILEAVEGIPSSPAGLATIFGLTVVLRNMLEGASSGTLFPPSAFLLHFPIAYVFPMLGITAMMSVLSGYSPAKLLKLMVYAWTLTLLPPILDLLMGERSPIGYFPLDRGNILSFLTGFFNPSVDLPGTTTGIRIEAAIGCLLAGVFVGSVSRRLALLRGILTAILFFPFFLLFFAWPQIIQMILQPLFPAAEQVQDFLQWHVATPPQLTGSVHNTVFLADMWPVMALGAWFWPRVSKLTWAEARKAFRRALLPGLAPAFAGCLAACLQAWKMPVTFADATCISAAFASASLAAFAAEAAGPATAVFVALSAALAAACGWPVAAVSLVAILAGRLPLPAPARRALTAPILLALAASPVFLPPDSLPALLMPAAAAALAGLVSGVKRVGLVAAMAAMACPLIVRPLPAEPAARWFLADATESFSRSSRNAHAHISSSLLAASGGPLLPLAEAAQLDGDLARSSWVCSLAELAGDSTEGILRVQFNIAMQRNDSPSLQALMERLERIGGDLGDIPLAILRQAAAAGDTSMLLAVHGFTGPSAQFLAAYAEATVVLGDTAGAVDFANSAVSRPDAGVPEFAFAIELSGIASTGEWDYLYAEGRRRLGVSPVLMLARIRAPLLAGAEPDRPDLVATCLALSPASPEALETVAAWMLAAGRADSALALAERSLLAQPRPGLRSFVIACDCARAAGEPDRLEILLRYAASIYPSAEQLDRFYEPAGDPGRDK